jgi:transposase
MQVDGGIGLTAPVVPDELRHASKVVGALPIINHFLQLLGLDELFQRFLPEPDRRQRLSPAIGLGILLRNLLLSREPLYSLQEWCRRCEASLLGLPNGGAEFLNDDRFGRCLDSLFEADRAALMTAVVVQAGHAFRLNLAELHNDSTTVTFHGEYRAARGHPKKGVPTHRITHGHNKDHRPDLKQMLYLLTTTAEGAVPVWCSVEHGNTTDDKTHINTWNSLRALVGSPDFLYVADSKLCTRENMEHIAQNKGRFLTVLPRTRGEIETFLSWKKKFGINWTEILRRPNARLKDGPDDVFSAYESHFPSDDGYRIIWIWSSQKAEQDALTRRRRLARATEELQALAARLQSPRSRVRDIERAQELAKAVLSRTQTEGLIDVGVEVHEDAHFKQAQPGRPTQGTVYVRVPRHKLLLHWSTRPEELELEQQMDGIFPLILNDRTLSMRDALMAYKHQPSLERRFEQLKSVLEIMPVFLKSHSRIEALLFLYFLSLLVHALIELQVRRQMATAGLADLPLYPEDRACERPTADRILRLFDDVRCHWLLTPANTPCRIFQDKLTRHQVDVLKLLGMSLAHYFSGIRQLPVFREFMTAKILGKSAPRPAESR